MPHAEESTMPNTMVNGEQPSSKFISHLKSYPVVSDSIEAYKSNPYGAKSLSIASSASDTFIAPVLPYTQRPYSLVRPYVDQADQLADAGLKRVDERFPVVKRETQALQSKARSVLGYPFEIAMGTKDYVFSTWAKEYKSCGEDGLVSAGKAAVSASMIIVSDTCGWISEFIVGKKKEAESALREKRNN